MTTSATPPVSQDPQTQPDATRLRGNLGTISLFFMILAVNAPLAIVVGFSPVIIGYGNQLGAPVAFAAAGGIIALFTVGYTAMSRHLPNSGGFYAYITAGLGRAPGLGGSFLALLGYYFALIGSYAFGGIALQSFVKNTLHGPNITWWVWVLVLQAATGILGYFSLEVSARVLSYCLAGEIAMVVIYDTAVLFQGGAQGISAESFTPHAALSGSVGIALLFGITCFGGFETATIFRDEARDPLRTVPRAMYLYVALTVTLYAGSTWVIIQAWGPGKVVAAVSADPTGSFLASTQAYAGKLAADIVVVLLNTSIFASILGVHNVTGRYAFNLSADRILPKIISAVHGRHGSPHRASLLVSVLALAGMVPFFFITSNPSLLYARLMGVFGYVLIVLMLLTALASLVYLTKHRPEHTTVWHRLIAPLLAIAGLGISAWLATTNFKLLISGSGDLSAALLALILATALFGVATALVLRTRRPDIYARIGRQ
ncbi:APC family permease [Streptomyces sp. NPDC051572]|uniref:APC family permease n=1 Tax=unclassified Streptomyces TaxID=2593676 RepID=UPI00344D08E5